MGLEDFNRAQGEALQKQRREDELSREFEQLRLSLLEALPQVGDILKSSPVVQNLEVEWITAKTTREELLKKDLSLLALIRFPGLGDCVTLRFAYSVAYDHLVSRRLVLCVASAGPGAEKRSVTLKIDRVGVPVLIFLDRSLLKHYPSHRAVHDDTAYSHLVGDYRLLWYSSQDTARVARTLIEILKGETPQSDFSFDSDSPKRT